MNCSVTSSWIIAFKPLLPKFLKTKSQSTEPCVSKWIRTVYNIPGVNSAGTFSCIYHLKIDNCQLTRKTPASSIAIWKAPSVILYLKASMKSATQTPMGLERLQSYHPGHRERRAVFSIWYGNSSKGSWEMFAMQLSWGHNTLEKPNPVSASQPLTGHLLHLDIIISIKSGYSKLRVCLIWLGRHPFLCLKNTCF